MSRLMWFSIGWSGGVAATVVAVTLLITWYDVNGLVIRKEMEYHHIHCLMIPK